MGSGTWSDFSYDTATKTRAATGTPDFAYTANMASTPLSARKVHESLDPARKNTRGQIIRECLDSDEHILTRGVAIGFDVTGSMGSIPRWLQENMKQFQGALIRRNYLGADPQVLMAGIGDATVDRAPLQVGQFESDLRIDEDLRNLYLEGGGGGTMRESYELFLYFMARHAELDSVSERGEMGYLFTVGDEMPYLKANRSHIQEIIGDTVEADVPTASLIADLQENFVYYHIFVRSGSYPHDEENILAEWKALLGERVIDLSDYKAIPETILMAIGLSEGYAISTMSDDLAKSGFSAGTITSASTAVSTVVNLGTAVSTATSTEALPEPAPAAGGTTHL